MKRQGSCWGMAMLVVMLGCAARAPRKPAGLPSESFWVGDGKAGLFVVIGPKDRDGWLVKEFDDRSGALKADGLFNLRGIARAEIGPEDIDACQGTALHLRDGAWLVAKVKR